MTRIAILFLVGFAAVATPPSTTAARQSVPATPVTIPFELAGAHILLNVRVNDSPPLSFLLDTGATPAIVRMETAQRLGLDLHGSANTGGAGPGTQAGQRVKGARWSLAGLKGFSQPVSLALPLPRLPSSLGQAVDGIIGGEFIREFVLELDYQARTIVLHDRQTFRYNGTGETLPLEFDAEGHPVLKAAVTPLGGRPIEHRFLLDTGAGGALVLHSPFVREHHLPGPSHPTIRALGMFGAGGESLGRTGRVASLQIGPFTLRNPITVFSQDERGSFANRSLAGNIGFGIANRFRLFLDYRGRRIILEPSQKFDEPFEPAMAGVALRADGPDYRTFRVVDLLEDAPGAEAGLKQGDVITAVDGVEASGLTLSMVREMLSKAVVRDLTIRRGGETIIVRLTPRKLI